MKQQYTHIAGPAKIYQINTLHFLLKTNHMGNDNKDHSGSRGNDKSTTRHKGESQQGHQKHAESVGHQNTGKHTKDESGGSRKNTTKKGANSI